MDRFSLTLCAALALSGGLAQDTGVLVGGRHRRGFRLPLGIHPPPKPAVFSADRLFVFLIRDNRNGSILFLGRLTDPSR